MKARQLHNASDLVGKAFGRGARKDEKRPRSHNGLASRCASRRMKRGACTLLLSAFVVSAAIVGRAAQNVAAASAATPNSTSLNGPGNVFLTANLFGSGGTGTLYAAVADFNGDGKLDYVTANQGNNTIGIALGNGDGTFKAPTSISVACNPVSVAVGDFNGDGKLDLAVSAPGCSPGTNGVAIFIGNGDGTFTAGGKLASPLSNPISAVVADFNGDGKMDLAVVDRGVSSDSVFFFFGNGDGTFQTPTSVSLGVLAASNQIVAADFNKDGHLDVAVSEINGSNVVVILGAGNGTFQAPRTIALPAQGWGVAVGDFNGDGVPDLVATTPANGGVSVFLGKGDGNFNPVNNPTSGTLPTAFAAVPGGGAQPVAAGDFNKDGKLDIIAGLSGVNSAACVAVLLGNGDGTFKPELLFGVADTPQSLAVGDFNGDGHLDWMASTGQINSANTGSVTVGLGRGDGTFLATEAYVASIAPGFPAIADFNKDGKLDVVVPNQGASFYSVFLGNGDGSLQPAVNVAIPGILSTTAVAGDFNGDGNQDFVEYNNSGCPTLVWFFPGKGDGTFGAGIGSSLGACYTLFSTTRMVAADFNGDGKLDLAMVISTSTGPAVAIMLGNGDGTFQAPKPTPAPGARPTCLEVADLNKDGKLDMVVTQYQENTIQIFLGNGDGTFQAPTTLATGRLPAFTVLGDFNGDGSLDIFVGNQLDVNAEIFLGTGNGTFLAPSIVNIQPTNSPPSIEVIGDFNLDGHLDVLLGHNDNRGTGISLLLGNGDGTFQPVQNYLVSGFSGVLGMGDFNGDGAPDALLVDTGENFISILLNQTPPPVSVLPKSLAFANQIVGTSSATQPIAVKNNGATATPIGIAVSGDFTQTNTCPVSPATLAVAANCTVNVAFKPSTTGLRNGAVMISYNFPGSPQNVNLTGTGVAPIVTLGASSVTFANQIVGTNSTAQVVGLTNTGTSTLNFTGAGITITGTNSGDFSETNTCGASVAAGAMCNINITFKPTATGSRSASLSINDDASGSPQTVPLSGTGVAPVVSLSPTSLSFGNQPVGTSSASQNVTLTNGGNAALSISSIAITGANSGDFSQTNACPISPATLAASASCTISVTFKPTATSSRSASVSITDNVSGSPQNVALTGTGTPAAPVVTLSPTSLNFGNQRVGTSSAAQSVTLTNTGNATLTLSIAIAGTNSGDFSQTNTCGASVAAGANCTINVIFKPTSTGNRSASVTITDNASGTPHSVALTGAGTAPAVTLAPTSLNFAGQLVTTSSAAQAVTLTNNGTATLNMTSIAITGANNGDFTQTSTCGASVAANANCTISVTFKPTATGNRVASVAIADDASGSPQIVSLTGTGTDFTVDVAAGGSNTATVNAGQPATYNLQVTPVSGFNGTVALSCAGAPSRATCTPSPASVTPNGTTASAFAANVSTTAPSIVAPRGMPFKNPPFVWVRVMLQFFLAFAILVLLARLAAATRSPNWAIAPVAVLLLGILGWVGGCGSAGGGGGVHNPGTPSGTYTLTVTGTSGGVSHPLTLTLKVN